jgi:hypothetical protein
MDKTASIDDFCFKSPRTGSQSNSSGTLGAKNCLAILARCVVIAALIFVVSTLILPPYYGTVDDVRITMIASGTGICQNPEPHIIYGHIFWGQALAWLYSQNQDIPWYGLSLSLANIMSLALVLAVFTWERASPFRLALLLILYVFSILPIWTNLQYVSTAVFLAAGACLVVISARDARDHSIQRLDPVDCALLLRCFEAAFGAKLSTSFRLSKTLVTTSEIWLF